MYNLVTNCMRERILRYFVNSMIKTNYFQFQTKLAIVYNHPETAALLGLGEGLVPSDHGSVIILTKCKDVTPYVEIRPTEECYKDLPVFYKQDPYFRNPKNFVLQKSSVQVDCHQQFSIHRIGDCYYKQVPNGVENVTDTMNITVLFPKKDDDTFINWAFQTLGSLFGKFLYIRTYHVP